MNDEDLRERGKLGDAKKEIIQKLPTPGSIFFHERKERKKKERKKKKKKRKKNKQYKHVK